MTKPNYMEGLLESLRDEHGIHDPQTLAVIREELVRSFKNGLKRGRELARGDREKPRETQRTR